MNYNKSPISLREGSVYIDGYEVLDCVSCDISFTPELWQGKQLGEKTDSTRWLGGKIAGNITRRRSTPWTKTIVAKYMITGETPEMKIQGLNLDKNSDFYKQYGKDLVTVVGCVLTGAIPLTALDSGGQVVEDKLAFAGKAFA